ncbi:MAG: ExbD/TolR family protein [Marinomonas sp.]
MKIADKFAAKSQADDDSMVPLINVVFLMLVFFMVAGQIRKADPIPVMPPTSINDNRAKTDANIVIVVGEDSSIYVDDNLIKVDAITPILEEKFNQATDKKAFWVQIKADGLIPIDALRPVFSEIRAAGLTNVSLATQLARGSQ